MLFAVICTDKPGAFDLRARLRPDHVAFLAANERRVEIAGPFLDGAGRMNGSLLVIEAADEAEARTLLSQDPYARAGLFANVELRAWKWTVGGPK